jgi:hypothetical protein
MPLYGYADVGRFGLAHGILAWARCVVWCEETGAQMIAPRWLRFRVGPYLRRERDKRNYFMLFHRGDAIAGMHRVKLLLFGQKHFARHEWPPAPSLGRVDPIMVFRNAGASNEAKFFHQIVGHGPFLRDQLIKMVRPRYLPMPWILPQIAIHVRLGDFTKASKDQSSSVDGSNMRLPIDWYADRLLALRKALGRPIPAVLFSDGCDEDLVAITKLPHVSRARKQQSVTDLLEMGQGIAVISSGSGFSLWGAFLGSAPRLCYPGQMIVPAYEDAALEVESASGETLPDAFIAAIRKRLAG